METEENLFQNGQPQNDLPMICLGSSLKTFKLLQTMTHPNGYDKSRDRSRGSVGIYSKVAL